MQPAAYSCTNVALDGKWKAPTARTDRVKPERAERLTSIVRPPPRWLATTPSHVDGRTCDVTCLFGEQPQDGFRYFRRMTRPAKRHRWAELGRLIRKAGRCMHACVDQAWPHCVHPYALGCNLACEAP